MPEVPNLHPLFVQLQTRYPTSGLLTELVQSHTDRFVVRAIVQLGTMTLATSLASGVTVEQAEDQARLRVLALLGIYPDMQPTPFVSLSEVPIPSTRTAMTSLGRAFKDTTLPSVPLPSVPMSSVTHPDPVTSSTLPDGDAIVPPASLPTLALEPVPLADNPKASFSTAAVTSSGLTHDFPDVTAAAWEAPPDELLPDDMPPDYDEVPYADAQYDEEPYDASEPFLAEEPDRAVTANDPLPTVTEAPTSKSKARKPSSSKTPPVSDVDASGSPSRDLSSLISQIGVEIDRIGWSKRQGSTYLQKTYGKKTRSELTDDELEDFLTYLNTQPSAGEGES